MKRSTSPELGQVPMLSAPAPAVGEYTLPVGFLIVLALLIYLAQAEGCLHKAQFSAGVYEPYYDLRGIPRAGGDVNRVEEGRQLYTLMGCANCHQPNGSGNTMNNCPPLANSDWVLTEGPGRLIRIVLHGARGPIVVNGQLWDNGNMTPMGHLTDDQIANILTYIRQSPEWGNEAPEVTPDMVRVVREQTADRTAQWTAAELEQIPPEVQAP